MQNKELKQKKEKKKNENKFKIQIFPSNLQPKYFLSLFLITLHLIHNIVNISSHLEKKNNTKKINTLKYTGGAAVVSRICLEGTYHVNVKYFLL